MTSNTRWFMAIDNIFDQAFDRITELEDDTSKMVMRGRIEQVTKPGFARVKIFDLTTDELPLYTVPGLFNPPKSGEEVLLLCESGEIGNAVIIRYKPGESHLSELKTLINGLIDEIVQLQVIAGDKKYPVDPNNIRKLIQYKTKLKRYFRGFER